MSANPANKKDTSSHQRRLRRQGTCYTTTNNQSQAQKKAPKVVHQDIENLLYAMGDRPVSTDATVNALEDVLVEYITQVSYSMVNFAKSQNRTRVKLNDLAFTLRNDPAKLARFRYILEQSYRIERAKRMFDDNNDKYDGDSKNEEDADADEDEEDEGQASGGGASDKAQRANGGVVLVLVVVVVKRVNPRQMGLGKTAKEEAEKGDRKRYD
ncbi:Transcription initiation factor TFIID subunit 13 [Candida viswanathii]|uniref:Transcription initiation factor TFIID subunit 13 n=1 Tax=Candida viswanathii TaxID=5486 RepID=A0A367YI51_9ASCO|nr:Transcription initiation factor TFIID subunit 13 [Candida viswanathii]